MSKNLNCKESFCNYYYRRYKVEKVAGAYTPNFSMIDEFCTHPKIFTPTGKLGDVGIDLNTVRACPLI